MKIPTIAISLALFCATSFANAERVVHALIQTTPAASNSEFGVIYSSTGLVPAKLVLYCKAFVSDGDWDGLVPDDAKECGHVDLQVRVKSMGLSLFFMKYSDSNPLRVHLYVNPESTPLRAVLGTYTGFKAGAGVAAGGRTMVFKNDLSGVWALAGQAVVPDSSEPQKTDAGIDVGVDLSIPWLEVYLRSPTDMKQLLSTFKDGDKVAEVQ